MARPKDNSLKYYNQDTKDDDNLQYIEAKHGYIGYAVVHKLWKHIYGGPGGYYCPWYEINKMLFCKNNNITISDLDAIMETCYQKGIELFSRHMVEEQGILTSKGIQKRWAKIVKECGRKNCTVEEIYRLIPLIDDKLAVNNQETTPPPPLIGSLQQETQPHQQLISSETSQSKVNIKVKESKEKENGCVEGAPAPLISLKSDLGKNTSEKGMPGAKFTSPSWEEVDQFFFHCCKNFWDPVKASKHARKFYNHYSGQNWLTSAEVKITNWKAKAESWILKDREDDKKPVSRETPVEKEAKKISYMESVFTEYLAGTVKESGIPADFYDLLKQKELLILSEEETKNIFTRCGQDPVLSKKRAVAEYFDLLKKQGQESIFQLQK